MGWEYLFGSSSITTDTSGAKVSEMRYKPWGEVRYSWTSSQSTTPAYELTKYTFTGQYSYMDDPTTAGVTEGFGLMFYNARWYDPALGRFAQADTIVPDGVQGFDRYAYVNNNPMRYIDPSGHVFIDEAYGGSYNYTPSAQPTPKTLQSEEIKKLLGFENDDDYDNWLAASDNNAELADLLAYSEVGNVVKINWSGDNYYLMLVEHDDGLVFYSTEQRTLVTGSFLSQFTSGTKTYLNGAAILGLGDGVNTYYPERDFGDVALSPYTLPDNWHKAADGKGIVATMPRPDALELLKLGIGAALILGGGEVGPWAGAGLEFLTVFGDIDRVPVYQDQRPTRYVR